MKKEVLFSSPACREGMSPAESIPAGAKDEVPFGAVRLNLLELGRNGWLRYWPLRKNQGGTTKLQAFVPLGRKLFFCPNGFQPQGFIGIAERMN